MIIELEHGDDVYTFHRGMEGKLTDDGRLVPLTWRERLWSQLGAALWPKPSYRVCKIDAGVITLVQS